MFVDLLCIWLAILCSRELERSSCLCLSTNDSNTIYSDQNLSISVQNRTNCSSLASTTLVLGGITTTCFSADSTSTLSTPTNTSKRKVSTSESPNSCPSRLAICQRLKKFRKTLQNLSQDREENLLRKSMM